MTYTTTATSTDTFTPTSTVPVTLSPTFTSTIPVTLTPSVTGTPTNSFTPTNTVPVTWTYTNTATPTMPVTLSPTFTSTIPVTLTPSATATNTYTPANTFTITPTPFGTPILAATQVIVSSQPATITLIDGVVVSMPANTLSQSVTIEVAKYASSSVPVSQGGLQFSFMPDVYLIDTGGLEPQAGMSVTITLPYDPAAIPAGYTASNLAICYFDGSQWVILIPTFADTVKHTLTVVTNHFSWWSAVILQNTPTPVATSIPRGENHFVIYPNPARGSQTNLFLPGGTWPANLKIQIYSLGFRKVREVELRQVQPETPVTLDLFDKNGVSLANGFYYVMVTSPQGKFMLKLIILH